MYPQMVQQQQQQAIVHQQPGGPPHHGNQGQHQGHGNPRHVTPSPSPGLNAHQGMQGGGHLNATAGPYEPRGHVVHNVPPAGQGAVNSVPTGPPVPGVPPGTVPGIHPSATPVNLPPVQPYVKRERKLALLQDPNDPQKVVDWDTLKLESSRSGSSTPKPTGAVSDTSASGSPSIVSPSGQASKDSPVAVSVSNESVKIPPNATTKQPIKDVTSTTAPSTENNNNKNNSNLVTNKVSFLW